MKQLIEGQSQKNSQSARILWKSDDKLEIGSTSNGKRNGKAHANNFY
jgi:hypothetical protein